MKHIILIMAVLFVHSAVAQTKTGLKAQMERGKVVYDTYCLPCHQQDGAGVPKLNPPLVKDKAVMGDKTRLIKVLLKGSEAIPEAERKSDNLMTAHEFLTDEEIADVITFVRNSFSNKASAVTVAEVKNVRAKVK